MTPPKIRGEPYFVTHMPAVTERIRRLAVHAKKLGLDSLLLDTLVTVVEKLETIPLQWGDPLYATKHSGGLVLRGVLFPFTVQYAAYEQERTICILDIRVFPRHPLESD